MTTIKTIKSWWNSKCVSIEKITREPQEAGIRCTHGQALVAMLGATPGVLMMLGEGSLWINFAGLMLIGATIAAVTRMPAPAIRIAVRRTKVRRAA